MASGMKALVVTAYGGPEKVELQERPRPEPKPDEVLIRVVATTLSSGDWRIRARRFPRGMGTLAPLALGWWRPRRDVLGTECAGIVAAVGSEVTDVAPGDPVIAMTGIVMGCHAEYVAVAEGRVIPKPAGLDWNQAAALTFGGTAALTAVGMIGLKPGDSLLVIGATGVVGGAAVQLGRAAGLIVTACARPEDAALVAGLGASAVIDNRAQDLAASGQQWNAIIDAPGVESWRRMRALLKPGGRFLRVAADLPQIIHAGFSWGNRRPVALIAPERREDLLRLAQLAEEGLFTPHIDSIFPLAESRGAHARADQGHKRGAIVIRMDAGAEGPNG